MTMNKSDYFKAAAWERPRILPKQNGERFYFNQHGKKVVVDEDEYQASLKEGND